MAWSPPDKPDPHEILRSARRDTDRGLHAQALAKFIWFHHNALRYDRALYGVRLSFALSYWMDLAAVYPPALAEFIRTRDAAETAFQSDPSSLESFRDLASMNNRLGDVERTANLFIRFSRINRTAAARLYYVAEPFLIATGRYDACGPFLDPPTRLEFAEKCYQKRKCFEETQLANGRSPPPTARSFFMEDVATFVGLLCLNHRADDAVKVKEQALAVLDDDEFRALLDAAMSGHLPPRQFG